MPHFEPSRRCGLGSKPHQGVAWSVILWFEAAVCSAEAAVADLFWLSDEQWAVIEPFNSSLQFPLHCKKSCT